MSGLGDKLSRMSPIKLALAASEMRGRAAVVNAEPLAIIGIGCRFPGNADSPESFWRLLSDGVDATSDVPAERWDKDAFYDPVPHTPGKMISRRGGFAPNLQEFDADFFGISPREATTMDPQQRTLLEVTWETIENAGIPHGSLVGTTTGVFVGISGIDYFMHLQACNHEIDAYLGTGNALSVASGRLSYVLGLQGPSVSVDTACSSSLVAVHLACQSLRNRECDAALAGGTHRIILPHGSIGLSQAHLLAPDGRCKTFDSSADGYVRGEGCGMVLLKRLSDAIADGDRIAALIRGSAVNQDGKTSGLTVPNGPAQQAVLRKALENAAVEADQVGYVEAHGTGTPLGDPIEVTALAGVFGNRRVGPPLLIGSVKTNVGHLEAAAGIAGLLKVALSLQHKEIPPHLHLTSPNPHIPWKSLPITVATKRTPWPGIDGGRIGGVSSFSFSGTNAHAVLQETPPELVLEDEPSDELPWTPHLLTLSAKTPEALRALALRYESYLKTQDDHRGDALYAICQTASSGRTHFSQRLSLLADSPQEAQCSLSDWIAGTPSAAVFEGRRTKAPRIGFYFETHRTAGPVGRELYERQRHFRSALEPANGIWNGESSLRASFAVEIALAEMWKALGIAPAFVSGRGGGEFAAACFAGVFSFDAGLRLLAAESEESIRSLTSGINFAAPRIPLLSSTTGKRIHDEVRDAEYWLQRLRELARSESAAERPETSPCDAVLGIGLRDSGRVPEASDSPFSSGTLVPTLSASGTGDWQVLMKGLAVLYACGASPNWDALYEDRPRRRVPLPTYPFQRERFWVDPKASPQPGERRISSVPPPEASRAPCHIDRAALLEGTDVERRAALQEYVTEQLADILKKPTDLIAAHEPLQSVGIDSLMAMELKYRIEADLSIALEIRSLDPDYALTHLVDDVLATFEGSRSTEPTPRIGLTRDSEGAPAVSFLSAHGDGGRRPLFFIHPGGIDISTYLAFAEHLDPSQPIHVLQPHGLYGGHFDQGENVVEATIAQAASLCASEVLRLHPEGPYRLAGWSMGGLVAYEMTRQLVSAGRSVALLGLLDVMCGPARDGSTLVAWFADLLEARTGRSLNYSFVDLMELSFEAQVESIWSKAVASEAVHPSMPREEFRMLFDRYKDALVASSFRTREYTLDPRLCADRVVFFNCVELARPERRAVETLFDWSAYSPNGLEIRSVPGNHYSMLFEPAVGALATAIQRCLDDVEGAPRTPEPVRATPADPAPDSPVRR